MKYVHSYEQLLAWWNARKRKRTESIYTNKFSVRQSVLGFVICEYKRPVCQLSQDNVLQWLVARGVNHDMKRTCALFGMRSERISVGRYLLKCGINSAEFHRGLKLNLTTQTFSNTLPPLAKRGDPEMRKTYLAQKRRWVQAIRSRIAYGVIEAYAAQARADGAAFAASCKFSEFEMHRVTQDYYFAKTMNDWVVTHDLSDLAMRRLTYALLSRVWHESSFMDTFNRTMRSLAHHMHVDVKLYSGGSE